MNPRKKSKPNPQAPADGDSTGAHVPPDASNANTTSTTPTRSDLLPNNAPSKSLADSTASSNSASTPTASGTQTPKGKKWLSGSGSWRSKAPAVVKTATESIGISVSGGAAGELPHEEGKQHRDDSPTKFLTKRKSSKGNALPTSITKVNVSSDGQTEESAPAETAKEDATPAPSVVEEPPLPPHPPAMAPDQAANTWAWRSWWSRPDGYSEADKAKAGTQGSIKEAQSTPLPGPTPSEEPDAQTKGLDVGHVPGPTDQQKDTVTQNEPVKEGASQDADTKDATATDEAKGRITSGSSWFWLWSSAQNAKANTPPVSPPTEETSIPPADEVPVPPADLQPLPVVQDSHTSQESATLTTADGTTETASTTSNAPAKPSAWAFWYRGKPEVEKSSADGEPQKHVGEVAVYNTPSQSHPEAAQFNEQGQSQAERGAPEEPKEPPKEPPKAESLAKKSFRSLRGRPKSIKAKDTPTESASSSSSSKTATPTKASPVLEPTRPETAPAAQPAPKQLAKVKQEPPNLLLPEFKTTYRLVHQPNFWQQIRQYFLGGEAPMLHLHINPAPPKIKKAVAIGVHGFFPAPIIQKVLGQPTGTSIRFANAAAAAIKDWTEARGYAPEIEQIALEGEGFIAERVNTLWKLLLNWIEHIKQADFILVACHSQGVPVAMMLVAKLIQFGCVNATRIGICAMAGVNMGPFIEYKTKYFGPTAAELFEFSNPKSLVSQMYLAALDEVLRFGVRIFYVGSIDDQLVSLEVSQMYTIRITAYLHVIVFDLLHPLPSLHLPRRLR
tara:strand:+ start:4552 stop:6909 length:2358 start_codon:yes stop_codon:yes gene_type:complete